MGWSKFTSCGRDPTKAAFKKTIWNGRRLAKLLSRGLSTTTGFVLPLEFDGDKKSLGKAHSGRCVVMVINLDLATGQWGYRLPIELFTGSGRRRHILGTRHPFDPRSAF